MLLLWSFVSPKTCGPRWTPVLSFVFISVTGRSGPRISVTSVLSYFLHLVNIDGSWPVLRSPVLMQILRYRPRIESSQVFPASFYFCLVDMDIVFIRFEYMPVYFPSFGWYHGKPMTSQYVVIPRFPLEYCYTFSNPFFHPSFS